MSGRNLPDHCTKAGPAFCAWQFPNVSMTSATDAKSYSERWSVKPGFLDPFHVAYHCVKRLKAATFVNVKHGLRKDQVDKTQLCPGLQIYLGKIVPDKRVNADVNEHIAIGSGDNVTGVIRRYPCLEHVLLFLLKYLKERGPLIKFKYNSREVLNTIAANPRYLVNNFMTTLCEFELEFQAAVVIGDYLNYLTFVAISHDLFWIKELLADIWGPVLIDFVNVGANASDSLKDFEKKDRLRMIALRMIETVPWERLKNAENFKITINPQINDSYLKRKSAEAASLMHRLTTRPIGQVTLLSGPEGSVTTDQSILTLLGGLNDAVDASKAEDATASADGDDDDPAMIAQREAAEAKRKRQAEEAAKKAANEIENRDFSADYGYTPEFIAKHAPQGMCKMGFDTTLG